MESGEKHGSSEVEDSQGDDEVSSVIASLIQGIATMGM